MSLYLIDKVTGCYIDKILLQTLSIYNNDNLANIKIKSYQFSMIVTCSKDDIKIKMSIEKIKTNKHRARIYKKPKGQRKDWKVRFLLKQINFKSILYWLWLIIRAGACFKMEIAIRLLKKITVTHFKTSQTE